MATNSLTNTTEFVAYLRETGRLPEFQTEKSRLQQENPDWSKGKVWATAAETFGWHSA